MVEIRGVRGLSARSLLVAGLILAVSGYASANPIVPPPAGTPISGLNHLFIGNLALDMLLFSLVFLLLLWRLRSPMWSPPKTQNMLVALVLLAGIAIAATGAVVDFYTLYEEAPGGYWPVMSTENMILGAIGVFATIYVISFAVARLRILPSLVPSSVMAAFSVLIWTTRDAGTIIDTYDRGTVIIAGIAFLLLPPVVFGITYLRTKKGVQA